ncbi:hypothetical protein DL1_11865 [Thioclava dalianensis]|uniref:Uncharacterized protein n=1 Tax=Thioclava dalianensis TaxID=1185766 RepID=A0A074T9N8_9RHOB|nr:hypothetical protein [Thioclava dalianensis]KEP68404.1 hypothetical protein DL1_11865 [Thioclava dalianensis]SFN62262.1 hypothetical protein SAMN05216224_10837 [Thioclava dalianensis]
MGSIDKIAVSGRADLPVGDCVATVLEGEGAVQVVWARFLDAAEPAKKLWNDFPGPDMPAQLRVLADALELALARRDGAQ